MGWIPFDFQILSKDHMRKLMRLKVFVKELDSKGKMLY